MVIVKWVKMIRMIILLEGACIVVRWKRKHQVNSRNDMMNNLFVWMCIFSLLLEICMCIHRAVVWISYTRFILLCARTWKLNLLLWIFIHSIEEDYIPMINDQKLAYSPIIFELHAIYAHKCRRQNGIANPSIRFWNGHGHIIHTVHIIYDENNFEISVK